MIRTVPDTGNDEIELYIRTYFSLLRSTDAIKIEALSESHAAIASSLHTHARATHLDVSALTYSCLRVPFIVPQLKLVVLGQLVEDFKRAGYGNVEHWQRVHAPGRRRRSHFDGDSTLAVMIASRSDIDDLVPILAALQIEWNKAHRLFQLHPQAVTRLHNTDQDQLTGEDLAQLATALGVDTADISRLQAALKEHFLPYLRAMADHKLDLSLQLLASSLVNYRKAASRWWDHLELACQACGTVVREYPVYFVSSNTHAIANLVSGYAHNQEGELQRFMGRLTQSELLAEWESLQDEPDERIRANFLYYLLKKYQATNPDSIAEMHAVEQAVGLNRVEAEHGFDVEAQVLQLNQLNPSQLDPRLRDGLALDRLAYSDALVINIDYPLGMAAFELLSRVGEGCDSILGVYVMGKAATLNGRIGDVMLANVVHDEHSQNTYLFNNCFKASHLMHYLAYGMLLDNQKALTARGTFLQNREFMDVFYQEGYTVLEMEAGPYLSAVYEMMRPVRHPHNEIVNLYHAPFDLGFIHYASDTPFSKGQNLGAGSLGYQGMDATYAAAVAILRRIFGQEIARLEARQQAHPLPAG